MPTVAMHYRLVQGPPIHLAIVTLALLLFLVESRLTQNGFLHAQTVAVTGRDYLLFPDYRVRSTTSSPRRSSPPRIRKTLSSESPFFTLHHEACARARPQAVLTDHGFIGIISTISASDLSKASSSQKQVALVLFHGGPSCKFSRRIMPTWVRLTRYMRASCLLAVDAAEDSMMNYNLMVVGFPTIMRVPPENSASYRGNRTLMHMIAWAVSVEGDAAMSVDGINNLAGDMQRYGLKHNDLTEATMDILDVREETAIKNAFDWRLICANTVTALYALWQLTRLKNTFNRIRKRRRRDEHERQE